MVLNIGVFQNAAAKVLTILFVGSILVSIVTAHQCYICGSFGLIGNGTSNRNLAEPCSNFNPDDSKFIEECGMDSKGCSIVTNGSIVTRSCEKYAIEDCKMANNVEYCYCSAELCNKFHPTFIDDEDLTGNEGSGDKTTKTVTTTPIEKDPTDTTTRHVTKISTKLATIPAVTETFVTNTNFANTVTVTPEVTKLLTNATVMTTTTKVNNTSIKSKIPGQSTDNSKVSNGRNIRSNISMLKITILLLFMIYPNY